MFPPRWIQSAVLLVAAAITCAVSVVRRYETTAHAVVEITANGAFAMPRAYYPGPYPKSIKLDHAAPPDQVQMLLNHMRVHSVGMAASFAGEFGSNVRILYFPAPRDEFLINPVVAPVEFGGEFTECHDKFGHELVKAWRARKIEVHYLSEQMIPTASTFKDHDACVIQAILEKI